MQIIPTVLRSSEFWGFYEGINAWTLRSGQFLVSWLGFVKYSCAKTKQEEDIRYPDNKDQTCPKKLNAPNQQGVD